MLLCVEWVLLIIFLGDIRMMHFKQHLTEWHSRFRQNFFFRQIWLFDTRLVIQQENADNLSKKFVSCTGVFEIFKCLFTVRFQLVHEPEQGIFNFIDFAYFLDNFVRGSDSAGENALNMSNCL